MASRESPQSLTWPSADPGRLPLSLRILLASARGALIDLPAGPRRRSGAGCSLSAVKNAMTSRWQVSATKKLAEGSSSPSRATAAFPVPSTIPLCRSLRSPAVVGFECSSRPSVAPSARATCSASSRSILHAITDVRRASRKDRVRFHGVQVGRISSRCTGPAILPPWCTGPANFVPRPYPLIYLFPSSLQSP